MTQTAANRGLLRHFWHGGFGTQFVGFCAAIHTSRLNRKGAATHPPGSGSCLLVGSEELAFFPPPPGMAYKLSKAIAAAASKSVLTQTEPPGRMQLSRPLAAGRV